MKQIINRFLHLYLTDILDNRRRVNENCYTARIMRECNRGIKKHDGKSILFAKRKLVLSITRAIWNKIARMNERNIDAKLTKSLKRRSEWTAEARTSSSKEDFRRLVVVKIRNRLFGNNNLVHSTGNSASAGTMLSYVGPISVSAFFRISRWTTRDQIATRLSELREREEKKREREKAREGASIFFERRVTSRKFTAPTIIVIRTMCPILCVLQRSKNATRVTLQSSSYSVDFCERALTMDLSGKRKESCSRS